jgi:hypothetical protein
MLAEPENMDTLYINSFTPDEDEDDGIEAADWSGEDDEDFDDQMQDEDDLHEIRVDDDLSEPDPEDDDHLPDDSW